MEDQAPLSILTDGSSMPVKQKEVVKPEAPQEQTIEQVAKDLIRIGEQRRQVRKELKDLDEKMSNAICSAYVLQIPIGTIAKLCSMTRQRVYEILSNLGFR